MKKLFTHDDEKGAITASAFIKITTPSGDVGPRMYRVILDGVDAEEIQQKIAAYVETLTPHYRSLHKVEPDIEWEVLCNGECIGMGLVKPSQETEE